MSFSPDRKNGSARAAFGLLIAGMAIGLFWSVRSYYDTTYFDSGTYIVTARALIAGEGYSYLGQPFILRPPGFAALLVPLLASGANFWLLNLYVSLFGALAIALLFCYLHERLGSLLAFGVAAAVWLNPYFQQICNQILSDVPGAALMLVSLHLERRARSGDSGGSMARHVILGLSIAAAGYVRLVYLLLIPAILLSRMFSPSQSGQRSSRWWSVLFKREIALIALIPLLLLLPWSIRNASVAAPGPSENTANYSYSTATWHVDAGDPDSERLPVSEIAGRIPAHLQSMLSALGSRLQPSEEFNPWELVLGILALGGIVWSLVRRRDPAEFLVLGMLASFSLAHATDVRLVIPIYLFALPAVLELLAMAVERLAGPRAGRIAAFLFVAGFVMLDADFAADSRIKRRHQEFSRLAAYLMAEAAPDAKLAAWDGVHLSVYLDRPVLGLEVVSRLEQRGGPERALELLDEAQIDVAVVADGRRSKSLRPSFRTEEKQGPKPTLIGLLRARYDPPEKVGPYLVFRTQY